MNDNPNKPWELLSRFVEIKSPWLTIIGEHLRDDAGKDLDYWRVEKEDSLVVIVVHQNKLLLPQPMYRPGIQKMTLDFCGGRISADADPAEHALKIVARELRLENPAVTDVKPINTVPLDVNSSFENQRLIGYAATLDDSVEIDKTWLGGSYDLTNEGITRLLSDITCLQCRALLLEWLGHRNGAMGFAVA